MANFYPGTQKTVEQFFDTFLGEDLKSSPITRDKNAAISMSNIEPRETGCLMGRRGCKMTAQPLYIKKLHTYRYTDDDGISQEELLAIAVENFSTSGGSLYRFKQGSFTVSRVAGSTSWDYNVDRNTSDAVFKFSIYQNGVVSSQLIDGGYEAAPYTIRSLCLYIDALTNFTCSSPKTAKVDGLQSNFSIESTGITVDTGHTISVGDWIPFYNRLSSLYEWREVINTSATQIYLKSNVNASFNDDDIIGLGRLPAVCLDLHGASENTTSPKTIYFNYWEKVPCPLDLYSITTQPFSALAATPGNQDHYPVSFKDHRNCCYITSNYALYSEQAQLIGEVDQDTNSANTISLSQIVEKYKSGVWKYDGKDFYLSGLPGITFTSYPSYDVAYNNPFYLTKGVGATFQPGTYKYRNSILYVDRKGNEIEFFNQFTMLITDNAGTFDVSVSVQSVPLGVAGNLSNYYNARYARANGATVASTTITVDAGHTIRTGDTIFVKKSTTAKAQRRKVLSWTNTTLVVDEAVTIADNNYISTILHRIWRTKANSFEYFLAIDIVNDSTSSTVTTEDDFTSDDDLGISITAVEPDYIQYSLPPANAISSHQNILVLGGGKVVPKQTHWENADSIEFTNPGVFSDSIPSVSAEDISALVTDTDANLSVFKSTAQFRFGGSLGQLTYELTKANDTGLGIAGPSAYAETEEAILGVCDKGLVFTVGGKYAKNFGRVYTPFFRRKLNDVEKAFALKRAQVFHDENKKRVLFFVPCETSRSGSPTGYSHNTNSKLFVWDYSDEESPIWYRFNYALKRMPSGGFAYYNGKLYFANWMYDTDRSAWTGYTYVTLENEVSSAAEDYLDNCESYSWELEMQWDNGDDPTSNKFWHEFILYMFQPENDLEDLFVGAFDVSFISQRDYSASKTDTVRTLTFSSVSDVSKQIQFDKEYKAKARNIKLYGTMNKSSPLMSGYQYTRDDATYGKDKFTP